MSISPEHARVIAREVLERHIRRYGISKSDINKKGSYEPLVSANAWATGVEIIAEGGETWRPSPYHMRPGSANYTLAAEAEAKGKLKYIVSETDKLRHLIDEASRHNLAYEACLLVFRKLLKQGDSVPPELADLASSPRPKEQGGAVGKKDLGRACLVEAIIEMAETCKIPPTGNDAKRGGKEHHNAAHYISQAAGISVDKAKLAWKEAKSPLVREQGGIIDGVSVFGKRKKFLVVQRPNDRG